MTFKVDGTTDAANTFVEHVSIRENDNVINGSALTQDTALEIAVTGDFTPFRMIIPVSCSDYSGFRVELETTGTATLEGVLTKVDEDDTLVIVEGVAYGSGTIVPAFAANDTGFSVTVRKGAAVYFREKVAV